MTEMMRDLRLLSSALGFLAVAMRQDNLAKGGAERATKIAGLIEEFCLTTVEEQAASSTTAVVDTSWKTRGQIGHINVRGDWKFEHTPTHTVIRVPANPAEGEPTVVEIRAGDEQRARFVAEQVVEAVNDNARKNALIAEMAACLELCLSSDNLSWEAEQEAELILKRVKAIQAGA